MRYTARLETDAAGVAAPARWGDMAGDTQTATAAVAAAAATHGARANPGGGSSARAPAAHASALQAPPAAPASFIGRRVRRAFVEGVFEGVVQSWRSHSVFGPVFHIVYPADGDAEEVAWDTLRDALVPEAAPAATAGAHVLLAVAAGEEAAADEQGADDQREDDDGGADHAATPGRRYMGVRRHYRRWQVRVQSPRDGKNRSLGVFDDPVAAAHVYDAEMRKLGVNVVNFPVPGSGETESQTNTPIHCGVGGSGGLDDGPAAQPVQRVKRVLLTGAVSRGGGAGAGGDAGQPAQRFKGVSHATGGAKGWRAQLYNPRTRTLKYIGGFATGEEAARAYDAAAHKLRITAVNFPRPGTREVQALAGQRGSTGPRTPSKPLASSPAQPPAQPAAAPAAPPPAALSAPAPPHTALPPPAAPERAAVAHAGEKRAHEAPEPALQLSAKTARTEPPSVPHASSGVLMPQLPGALAVQPAQPAKQLPLPLSMVLAQPAASSEEAAVESFLRAMQPPVEQLDAALSAIRGSGVTMAHLRRAAGHHVLIVAVASALRITRPFDRLTFAAALLDLLTPAPPAALGGGLLTAA